MENKNLDPKRNETIAAETPKSSYEIKTFRAKGLPPQYKNLVFSKWLTSLREGNIYLKALEPKEYYARFQSYIESILERPSAEIVLALLSEDEDIVLGWACREGKTLHYVYVNKPLWGKGISKELLNNEFDTVTNLTFTGFKIFSKLKGVKFEPWK